MSAPNTKSLYERIGGQGAMDAAIPLFYSKVTKDARVARFFKDIDMTRQAKKQHAFLTMAFGGPNNYTGRSMRNAHKKLVVEDGLDDSHFDAIIELLGATLTELGVPADLIGEAAAIGESVREDTLCRDVAPKKPFFMRCDTPMHAVAGCLAALPVALFLVRKMRN